MKEIRSRIEMAKKVFTEKKKLFIGEMNLELKKRFSEDETMRCCHQFTWTTFSAQPRRRESSSPSSASLAQVTSLASSTSSPRLLSSTTPAV